MSLSTIHEDYYDPDKHLWQQEEPASYRVVLDFFSAKDEEEAKKNIYKYTNAGMWLEFHDYGILIGSIVEGCDVGTLIYVLRYADDFTEEDIQKRVDAIEAEADEIWKWANEPCDKKGKQRSNGSTTHQMLGFDFPYIEPIYETSGRSS